MRKSKLVVIFLCLAMLLSACGGNKTKEQNPSSSTQQESSATSTPETKVSWDVTKNVDDNFPFDQYVKDEKAKWNIGREVELTWYSNWNYMQATKTWKDYDALKTAVEITGINVKAQNPTGDGSEKVRLMMATNDLPDLISLGFDDPIGKELIKGGYVYCLDDLFSKHTPNFQKNLPQILRTIGSYEEFDNKLYSLSGVTNPEFVYKEKKDAGLGTYGYSVRKDIWKALGEPSIATPDELENTLKLFKQKYPTMNGKTSIGIAGWPGTVGSSQVNGSLFLNVIGYSFGILDNYYDEATQIYTVKYLNPKYPEYIAYVNKLFREGLIDPEIFLKNEQQNTGDLSSCAFMMPGVWQAAMNANAILDAKDPESHFITIQPMVVPGVKYKTPGNQRVGGAVQTFIPKKCKDPEAAAKLLEYGFSPTGTLQICQGNPGKHYQVKDGVQFRPQAEADLVNKDVNAYCAKTGIWNYFALWYPPIPGIRSDTADEVKYDIPNSLTYAYDTTNERYGMIPDGTSDVGIALAKLNKIADNVIKAVTAKTAAESDTIIQKMIVNIRNVKDYQKIETYMTGRYKKNVERFGPPAF